MQVRNVLRLTAVLLAALLITGCASTHVGEGGKAAEGMAQVRAGLTKAQTDIDRVLTAMDNIGRGDLKASFNTYSIELSDLETMALDARKRARAMRDNSQQYMVTWEREVQEISDPNMKASSEQRREAVRAHYDDVAKAAQGVRDAYAPFVKTLQDIKKTLSLDLSPAALPAIEPAKANAHQEGETLNQRINALIAELDKIQTAS